MKRFRPQLWSAVIGLTLVFALLGVREARSGKGGHALSIELNGKLLTPDNVTILNNKLKIFHPISPGDENKDTWGIDVFDAAGSSWYLIKGNDYQPEYDVAQVCQSRMFLSNYYERLLLDSRL